MSYWRLMVIAAATGGGGCQDSDPRPVVQDIELSVEELNGVLQFLLRSKTDGQRRRPDPTSGTSSFSRFANTETGRLEWNDVSQLSIDRMIGG